MRPLALFLGLAVATCGGGTFDSDVSGAPTASRAGGGSSPGASADGSILTSAPGDSAAGSASASSMAARGALGFDHVFVIVEENHSHDEVLAGAPYLASLTASYASAGDYRGVAHPSQPNYLALVAGSTLGVTDDGWHTQTATTIATRLDATGKSWKTYSQSQGADPTVDAYPYAVKHNPLACFTQTDKSKLVPMTQLWADLASATTTPAFALLIPDLLHDAHDGSMATMDSYAQRLVTAILASPAYQNERSLIVVTFDEDDSASGNQVPCIFVSKNAAAGVHSMSADHYALLRTVEDLLGVPQVGAHDALATSMTWMFAP